MAAARFMPSEPPVALGKNNAGKCLILIHGLTLSGRQFAPAGHFLLNSLGDNWRIILPTAPKQKVTWADGRTTTAWFDLPKGSFVRNQDEAGLLQAKTYIHSLVEEQISQGIGAENIFIGGFSQGGALAVLSALTYPDTLGAAVCLSGYLPIADTLTNCFDKKLPLLFAHGRQDVPIPPDLAESAVNLLKTHGFDVDFYTYPIGHTLDEKELADVAQWLQSR
ncbi:alpha/beta hydrolase [Neisseria weixii]|uniref:alpha/beta hydrolase n=1 Tax=Neisseria weixii TaxID=1853276 RepID=UPI000BB7F5CB|nr:dienelactone hydrolase family protein [Neisseria weixii]ATD64170.1 phospholipase [Neisseria weixii]